MQNLRVQKRIGFSLLELTVVMALATALLISEMERQALDAEERRRAGLTEQMKSLRTASIKYWEDNQVWPTTPSQLSPAQGNAYIPANLLVPILGSDLQFKVDAQGGLVIEIDTGSTEEAEMVAGRLRGWGSSSELGKVSIYAPPAESISNVYYLRSGSRPLTGNMNVNRHSLHEVFELHAQDIVLDGSQMILSDPRSKRDIQPLLTAGEALRRIQPIRYRKDGRRQIGFSSAEVAQVFPELVRLHPRSGAAQNAASAAGAAQHPGMPPHSRLFLSYDGMVPVLWAEVIHLQQRLQALQAQLTGLQQSFPAAAEN